MGVCFSKHKEKCSGSKRNASRERPDVSVEREDNKMRKPVITAELKVLFKLTDQTKAGGFSAVNPLKVVDSLKSVGEGIGA